MMRMLPLTHLPRLPRPFIRLILGSSLVVACQTGDGENSHSGATNWLHCSTDQDCEEYAGATCADDGFCVDTQGERIVVGQSESGPDDDTVDDADDVGPVDDDTTDDDLADDDAIDDDDTTDDLADDDVTDDDATDDDGSNVPSTPSSGPAMEPSIPAPEPDDATIDGLDAGIPSTDLDASVDDPPAPDAGVLDAATCDFDVCHPERCDEVGEVCCDPFPGDGVNYCNGGLFCGPTGCEAPVECGPSTCANTDTCCDSCTGSCVDALSGANCPEDNRPADFMCPLEEQQFLCGETLCGAVTAEYCESFTGGPGITTYTCRALPAPCEGAPTCDCVLDALGPTIPETECTVGDLGELLIVPPPAP